LFLGEIADRGITWDGEHYPIRAVYGDQREATAHEAMFRRLASLRYTSLPWTGGIDGSKAEGVQRIARLLQDGMIRFPHHPTLQKQLNEYRLTFTRTGGVSYSGRGRHDDFAQVVVTAGIADAQGLIMSSPARISNQKHIVHRPRF
jgi:hypothetical protein